MPTNHENALENRPNCDIRDRYLRETGSVQCYSSLDHNYPKPIVLDQIIAAKHDRLDVTGAVSRSSSRHVTK
jgi:hypothetical protein